MSLFSSFLTADQQLTHDGFHRLGVSLGGTADRNFWFSEDEGGIVAEGHELFGDSLQRYQVSGSPAEETLYRVLVSILRSQHPTWTRPDCEAQALKWCQLLGFALELPHAA